jgi:hypothetical protein
MRAIMEIQVIDRPSAESEESQPSRPGPPLSYLSTAEVAECTCPEPCERDHDRD